MEGLPPLRAVDGNFCVVTEEMFKDYEKCKATLPLDDVLLPLNDLLAYFMKKHAIPLKTTEIFVTEYEKIAHFL